MTTQTTAITAEPGSHAIHMTRDFAATPEQLVRAYTDPAVLSRWLGPRGYELTVELLEARHGGRWRYVHHDGQGNHYGFHGVFHNDPSVDGITQTFEYEGVPGLASLDRVTFEVLGDGRTRLHAVSLFPSIQARDGMIASGMEKGVTEGYEQLDEWLASPS